MDSSFDPAKNAHNVAERSLPFDRAEAFDFQAAVIEEDTRRAYPERRFVALGWLDERLHVPCFTPAPGGIRVISFRKANAREERKHERTQQD